MIVTSLARMQRPYDATGGPRIIGCAPIILAIGPTNIGPEPRTHAEAGPSRPRREYITRTHVLVADFTSLIS